MRRCPDCRQPLRFAESYTDSRPDGLGPLGTEITFTVVRWACACGYSIEETTS